MTLDRSLKISGGLLRTRCVLTRAERIELLIEEGKFDPETDSVLGLPKVRVKHSKAGTKSKKEDKADAEGEAEGTAEPAAES